MAGRAPASVRAAVRILADFPGGGLAPLRSGLRTQWATGGFLGMESVPPKASGFSASFPAVSFLDSEEPKP